METYYNILGVAENASQDQIKAAYRKLAMELHPDRNQNNTQAEERFKKVNEAYSTLQDPQTRSRYDHSLKFGGPQQGDPFQNQGFDFHFNFGGGDINDIINQFFNGGFQRPARNRDFTFTLQVSLEDAFNGCNMPVQFSANGQNYNLTVNIPAGIDTGAKIRYQGYGDKSNPNVPAGDLYIQIHILNHDKFRRHGATLHTKVTIDALEACIGCERDIKCIDGQVLRVKIPEGTQPNSIIKLAERGMPVGHKATTRGDCLVNIEITIPTSLSEDEKNSIRQIIKQKPA